LSNSIANKKHQTSLDKWLILGQRHRIYKKHIEHLIVLESKQMLNTYAQCQEHVKVTQVPTERAPGGQRRNDLSNKIK
jgi:hypothetical protein